MANNYQEAIDKAEKDIKNLEASLDSLHKSILKNASELNKMLSQNSGSAKEVNNLIKERTKALNGLTDATKKQTETEKNLKSKTKELTDAQAKQKVETSALNREKKLDATITSKIVGAYANLIAKQKQARTNLRNLIVSQGENSKATIEAQREYDKLTKRVNLANKATSNFSKTGLGSAVRGFKNLLGAFGVIGGVQLIASFGKEVFSLTKELNSLDFSMQAIIKDQQELSQTQLFLTDITNRYGADIVSTTKRYIKFRAASKEANLTASETQKIFGTVTKAAGVLGLKTDELTGIYLALEQMISKGKVTTEELRRQLGERLPGAFDIMAKAVGVNTSELDKMLRAGEVLSAEALPKFVVELEKAYGIESVTKVDTMVASQIKMNNAWKNLVISVERDGGSISKIFQEIFNDFTLILNQIEKLNKSQGDVLEFNRAESYKQNLESIKKGWDEYIKNFKSASDLKKIEESGGFLGYLKREKEIQEGVNLAASNNLQILFEKRNRLDQINKLLPKSGTEKGALLFEKMQLEKAIERLEVDERSLSVLQGRLDAINELIKLETKEPRELSTDNKKAKKQKDALLELLKIGADINKQIVEDDQRTTKERLKELDNLAVRRRLISDEILKNDMESAKDSEDLQRLATANALKRMEENLVEQQNLRKKIQKDVLDDVKEGLDELTKAQNTQRNQEIEQANGDKNKIGEINKRHNKSLLELQSNYISDVLKNNTDLSEKQIKILTDMLSVFGIKLNEAKEKTKSNLKETQEFFKDTFGSVFETFSDAFDLDISKFDFIFDELAKNFDNLAETSSKLFDSENIGQWADAAKEIIGSVLDANLQRFEAQINAARRARDIILNDELATEEQKEAARKTFEEKQRKIQTERAKQERTNTLIKIAVDTAAGVAKVLAQTGVVAPFVIPTIIALGAAQAAFVASQPLPKFEKGTQYAPEGWAETDENGPELHTDKKGNIKDFGSSKGARYKYLEKGDKIFTAEKTKSILNELSTNDIQNAVLNMNMYSNGEILKQNTIDNTLIKEMGGIRDSNERVWREVKKLASRPVNVNNEVKLTDDRYY